MNKPNKQKNNEVKIKKKRWYKIIPIVFLVLFLLIPVVTNALVTKIYKNKIYPNVKVGKLNLGGLTKEKATQLLKSTGKQILREGIEFTANNKKITIQPEIASPADPDLSREIIGFNDEKTIEAAYNIGRTKNYLSDLSQIFSLLLRNKILPAQFHLDDREILTILKNNFSSLENPAQDAALEIISQNPAQFKIKPPLLGVIFNYDQALLKLKNNLTNLQNNRLNLITATDYPKIQEKEAQKIIPQAEEIIKLASLFLVYENKNWPLPQEIFIQWLTITKNETVNLNFDQNKVWEFLKPIAQEINVETKEARFKIIAGKVQEFRQSSPGKKLNLEKTLENLRKKIFLEKQNSIEIVVEVVEAKSNVSDINDLGISKLIGVGKSNFKGSPVNRRHNIKVGSNTLNGLLIKPEEVFSLVGALGTVDASTGYLPELVIKGNKTIPEFGGGLCQIGTTMFRAALNTGLPITERKNHSYRVVYYEPAGMDATIYNPKPDLRFVNDTGHYILIQTKISGDDLIFEMWGAPDGRQIEIENPPRIFNITRPEPTKIIETEELPPGEKKCTEKSHNGADAAFTSKVTYPDGKVLEEVWRSHYRPWQAVCLVGKTKEENKTPTENNNQSVLPNIESPTATSSQ